MGLGLRTLATPGAAEEIRGRMGVLTAEGAGRWGSMSVGEMVCHLHVCFRGAAYGEALERVRTPVPPVVMKWGGLRVPIEWPHGVKTVPALERGGSACPVPGEFAVERDRMFAALDAFLRARDNRREHPYFGRMTPWDWMRWGYLHADHHLRQFGR